MTKSTKSIKSPLHASRGSARGGPAERTKRLKARDSVESRSRTQRGRWGRMSTMTKSTEPNKYPWTWAERERWWRAEKEEGQIVRVSYLCSDLVWPRAT